MELASLREDVAALRAGRVPAPAASDLAGEPVAHAAAAAKSAAASSAASRASSTARRARGPDLWHQLQVSTGALEDLALFGTRRDLGLDAEGYFTGRPGAFNGRGLDPPLPSEDEASTQTEGAATDDIWQRLVASDLPAAPADLVRAAVRALILYVDSLPPPTVILGDDSRPRPRRSR